MRGERLVRRRVRGSRLGVFAISLLATVATLCAVTASASASLSLGLQWRGEFAPIAGEMGVVGKSGATFFRLPMNPGLSAQGNDWTYYDSVFGAAAEANVTILPHFGEGLNGNPGLPAGNDKAWADWAKEAVRRYGYNGVFWTTHPSIAAHPVVAWELWNEPNNPAFGDITATNFGSFVAMAGQAVQQASQSFGGQPTEVLLGGLLNLDNYRDYLRTSYEIGGGEVTGISFHPYLLNPQDKTRLKAFQDSVSEVRSRIDALPGGAAKSLWITETGWPAESHFRANPDEGPYAVVDEGERAALLHQSVQWAKANAGALKLRSLVWYNYRDLNIPKWEYHSGLRTLDGRFRSTWFAFQEEAGAPRWPAEAPTVSTEAATGVTEGQATLRATVNPNGDNTSYRFEYGETTSYGGSVPAPDAAAGDGTSPVSVSAVAANLLPHTRYHFRIVATNSSGTSFGPDRAFTTGLKWNLRNSNSSGNPDISFWFGLPGEIKVTGDWNGDGIASPGTYDPQSGVWKLRNSNTTGGADLTFQYGGSQFTPVVGDWDGNGTTTVGLFEREGGNWQLRNKNSGGSAEVTFQYGGSQFIPITGDWDGNGVTTIGLFEPQGGEWQLRNFNTGGSPEIFFQYGGSQFTPITGDWDGNGTTTVGLFEREHGDWQLRNNNSSGSPEIAFQHGGSQFTPVSGDWDGNATETAGLADPDAATEIEWNLRTANVGSDANLSLGFGASGEVRIAGDWNGDGIVTPGTYDSQTGVWKLRNSNTTGSADVSFQFGGSQFRPVVGDWDGNGTTTVGLYEPQGGNWQLRNQNSAGAPQLSFQFGGSQFTPVTGDWDGNGSSTIGLYEEGSGSWQLRNANSAGAPQLNFQFGGSGWKPAPGDWDGDGDDTVGVAKGFGPSLRWSLRNSNSASSPDLTPDISFGFGLPGELKVTGDWNGDGIVTPGTYDPQTGVWKLRNSNAPSSGAVVVQFGGSQFRPVAGDWDGNGTTTVGLYEPQAGNWQLRNFNTPGSPEVSFQFGGSQFTPLTGDWNSDGTTTIGLYEPQGGNWQLRNQNSAGSPEVSFQFGGSQFTPVSGDWDGNGSSTIGLYQRSTGTWQLRNKNSAGGPEVEFQFGGAPSSPVAGDWDGNGADSIGVATH